MGVSLLGLEVGYQVGNEGGMGGEVGFREGTPSIENDLGGGDDCGGAFVLENDFRKEFSYFKALLGYFLSFLLF